MEILVNHEKIDFTLEREESVGEVIDALAQWLESGAMAITAVRIDEEPYPIHDRGRWENLSLTDVSSLSVEALPVAQVQQTALEAIDEYCQLLESCITAEQSAALKELLEELPYVRSRIGQFFPELPAGSILSDANLNAGRIPVPADEVLAEIGRLRLVIDNRIREYVDPDTELVRSINGLIASLPALREIPVDLQTGRAGEAMHTVVQFAELFSRILRLLPRAEGGKVDLQKVRQFAESLAPHLSEVRDAIEAEDTVLLGDLMEYEVAPCLDSLGELVTSG